MQWTLTAGRESQTRPVSAAVARDRRRVDLQDEIVGRNKQIKPAAIGLTELCPAHLGRAGNAAFAVDGCPGDREHLVVKKESRRISRREKFAGRLVP